MTNIVKRFFLFSCLMLAALAAPAADSDLVLVQQRVAKVAVLRGDFTQEKRVAGFRNPLRSQGRFVLARDRGVVWSTSKPFPSEMVVTRERIYSVQRDGSRRIELDGSKQPAMRGVNQMLLALVAGDMQAMAARFDAKASALPGQGWALTLTPKTAALRKAFARIELQGDRYVRKATIVEAGGDTTMLAFSELSETPAALSAAEASRLD